MRSASPAPAVVAADDSALGQRADLILDGNGQGRIERPRDRPAAPARAHRPRRGRPQALDVGLERDDRERCGVRVYDRDRIGVRSRALGSAKLRGTRSNRGCDEVGTDRVRCARRYLDLHGLGPFIGFWNRPV